MLDGVDVKPKTTKDAKLLIGKRVQYLRNCDVDRTGRGLFFPRYNTIKNVSGRNLILEDEDSLYFNDIIEMIVIE